MGLINGEFEKITKDDGKVYFLLRSVIDDRPYKAIHPITGQVWNLLDPSQRKAFEEYARNHPKPPVKSYDVICRGFPPRPMHLVEKENPLEKHCPPWEIKEASPEKDFMELRRQCRESIIQSGLIGEGILGGK